MGKKKRKGGGDIGAILSVQGILSHTAERAHACTATVARQIGCLDTG